MNQDPSSGSMNNTNGLFPEMVPVNEDDIKRKSNTEGTRTASMNICREKIKKANIYSNPISVQDGEA